MILHGRKCIPEQKRKGLQGALFPIQNLSMTTNPQKVACVTGAAKRIGRAIALALAQRGWDIVVHYGRSAFVAQASVRSIVASGLCACARQCDLANESAVRALLPRAAELRGPGAC